MNDAKMLPRKYRKGARHNERAVRRAMTAASGITAHGRRKMARLDWEGNRSPSRLGRAGERAQQASAIITPAAAGATALITLAGSVLDLYMKYRDWKDHAQQPTPAPTEGGYNQNDEPPF